MAIPCNLAELESKIDYSFQDLKLLETALTHSSYANEQVLNKPESYERFEFLGDAVTGLEIALLIFEKGPHLDEGQMTAIRSAMVSTEGLSCTAKKIGLGNHIRLGVGAERTDVRENKAILEDALEALMAAIFLDGGREAVRDTVKKLFLSDIEEKIAGIEKNDPFKDYKSRLQTVLQKNGETEIKYELLEQSGPDHDKSFRVCVVAVGRQLGIGEGKTKKHAEKMAAKMALEELKCI
jgi:ribonuclease III, bacterial